MQNLRSLSSRYYNTEAEVTKEERAHIAARRIQNFHTNQRDIYPKRLEEIALKRANLQNYILKHSDKTYLITNDNTDPIDKKRTLTIIDKDTSLSHNIEVIHKTDGTETKATIIMDGIELAPDTNIQVRKISRTKTLQHIQRLSKSLRTYRLVHNYQSTSELAEAYNKAHIFTKTIQGKDGEATTNPERDHLLKVAQAVIYEYCQINNDIFSPMPSKDQVLEIVDLSALDNPDINERIYEILTEPLDNTYLLLKQKDYQLEGIIRMLNLLPLSFSLGINKHIVMSMLTKISDFFANRLIDSQPSSKIVLILEIYAKLMDILLNIHQLQKIKSIAKKPNPNKSNFLKQKITLAELDQGVRKNLMSGIKRFDKTDHFHMRYLLRYIEYSISRLDEKGGTSVNVEQLLYRSQHLFLAAGKLDIGENNDALIEFIDVPLHIKGAAADSKMTCHHWYDETKRLLAMLPKKEKNLKQLKKALDEISSYYKDSKNPRSWEMTYILLQELTLQARRHSDEETQKAILLLAKKIINDNNSASLAERIINYVHLENEASVAAYEISIAAYASPFSETKELAEKIIGDDKFPAIYEAVVNEEIERRASREENPSQNELLQKAKAKIFPLEQKINSLRESNAPNPVDFHSVSINGNLNEEEPSEPLGRLAEEFIYQKGRPPALVVHGSAGTGKSTFGINLARRYWDRYTMGATIPLFISSSLLDNMQDITIETLLTSYGFAEDEINSLQKERHRDEIAEANNPSGDGDLVWERKTSNAPRLLIILDGCYAENKHMTRFLSKEQISKWPSIKVIIIEHSKNLDAIKAKLEHNFEEAHISPLDDFQVKEFISSRMRQHHDLSVTQRGLKQLIEYHGLAEPARNPFILETMVDWLLKGHKEDLGSVISYQMHDFLITTLGVLEDSPYYFVKSYFKDFLVAIDILKEIRDKLTMEKLADGLLNKMNLQQHPAILQFILDEVTSEDAKALEEIILSTKTATKAGSRSKIAMAAANAATIYVRTSSNQIIANKDWSHTQIPGAYIAGAYFYKMNFTGCDWSNVIARSIIIDSCRFDDMIAPGFRLEANAEIIGQALDPGHDGLVTAVAVSDNLAFSGGYDKTIRVWDINEGKCLKVIREHNNEITSLCVQGKFLISSSGSLLPNAPENTIKVFDITNNYSEIFSAENQYNHKHLVNSMCANSTHMFSGGGDKSIKKWHMSTGKLFKTLLGHLGAVTAIYIHKNYLISGGMDKSVIIWDLVLGESIKLEAHTCWVNSVCANDSFVFSGGNDKTVKVWDIKTGELIRTLESQNRHVESLCANEEYLFAGCKDSIKVWDIATGELVAVLGVHARPVVNLYISENQLTSADINGMIIRWDITNIRDIKLVKAVGRRTWEQKSSFVKNKAEKVYGFSEGDQGLFGLTKENGKKTEVLPARALISSLSSAAGDMEIRSEANPLSSANLRSGVAEAAVVAPAGDNATELNNQCVKS